MHTLLETLSFRSIHSRLALWRFGFLNPRYADVKSAGVISRFMSSDSSTSTSSCGYHRSTSHAFAEYSRMRTSVDLTLSGCGR